MKFTLYYARSKKSGKVFSDNGDYIYIDNDPDFPDYGELSPDVIFLHLDVCLFLGIPKDKYGANYRFRNHTPEEVEFIPIECEIK